MRVTLPCRRHAKSYRFASLCSAGLLFLLAAVSRTAAWTGSDQVRADGLGAWEAKERLVYKIVWSPPLYLFVIPPIEVGEATLTLSQETRYRDRKAFKILFTARSSGTLVKLAGISIDDTFEFTTDADTFCTYAASKREREGQRMRDIEVLYLPEGGKLHLREVDVSKTPPRLLRDSDIEGIPPCVKDLFSALYSLRRNKLNAESVTRVVVGDNQHVKEVEVKVEKRMQVSTPAGTFDTWQVNTISLIGGLFKGGGQFRMWLSDDARGLPVRFEAKVNLGKVTGSLKGGKY
jgi:hypothetical protein